MHIEHHSNFDLVNIVTSLNVEIYEELLRRTHFNEAERRFLVDGFSNGFDIEYQGPTNRTDRSRNIPFSIGDKFEMWEKMMKETKAKRFAGPFKKIPFKNYIQSPIGLVPKAGNKTCLIFHLSYDFPLSGQKSVNFHTPRELCSVHYRDLDHAVQNCLWWNGEVKFSSSDLQMAFRNLPLKVSCFKWLVMVAENPETGEMVFFIEKALPFGGSISCSHFQRFSNSLKHLVEAISGQRFAVTNYLDDFLFVHTNEEACNSLVRTFLRICNRIGSPVALEKTNWASSTIVFLGILMEGDTLTLSIPNEKRVRATHLLSKLKDSNKATVKQLQSLTGFLNFLNKAIFPGRAFTRRMYSKYSEPKGKKWQTSATVSSHQVGC